MRWVWRETAFEKEGKEQDECVSKFCCRLTCRIIFRISIRARNFCLLLNCLKGGSRDNKKHLPSSTSVSSIFFCRKIWSSDSPFHRPQRPLGRVEIEIYSFITSAVDGGWSASRPGRHYLLERPVTHCIGGWVGPRAGLDGCGKSCLFGIRSPDLAATEASVFLFTVCTILSNILTLSAWSPIIWTRKLTYPFLISVQLEAHSNSWRPTRKLRTSIYSLNFCRCNISIFYYTKVVFSPPPIFTFLRPLR